MPIHRFPSLIVAAGALLAASCGTVFAQGTLTKVRLRISDSLMRTPHFLCTQTVERSVRMGKGAAAVSPIFRVDAGVIEGKELYVKPADDAGEKALTDLMDVLASAGTGTYAIYSRQVFQTTVASFYDVPEETIDGRKLLRWDFQVPRESSRFTIVKGNARVTAGYAGSFWADASSYDLVRLVLRADDLPAETGIKSAVQTIDWVRSDIGSISVLLPKAGELEVVETSGRETRVRTQYDDCRKYVPKEATKMVDLAATAAAPVITVGAANGTTGATAAGTTGAAAAAGDWLPGKLNLDTALETAVDERTTAVNDTITLKLNGAVKHGGQVLIPKGAKATARVTRISTHNYRAGGYWRRYYLVGVAMETIDAGDRKYRVQANLEIVGPTTDQYYFIPYSQDPAKWGTFVDIMGFENVRDQFSVPVSPGESVLGVGREYLRVPKNLRMVWSTQEPAR